jgi:hypothetical protein
MNPRLIPDDGPSLEEACLWDDLTEVAENEQLRAQLAAAHHPARARRPARVG